MAMYQRIASVLAFLIWSFGSGCTACDCYVPPGVTIHLVDAVSGQPVEASKTAFEYSNAKASDIYASCVGVRPENAISTSGPCSNWEFYLLGPSILYVNISGFQPMQISINTEVEGYCCPHLVNPVDETIRLLKQ